MAGVPSYHRVVLYMKRVVCVRLTNTCTVCQCERGPPIGGSARLSGPQERSKYVAWFCRHCSHRQVVHVDPCATKPVEKREAYQIRQFRFGQLVKVVRQGIQRRVPKQCAHVVKVRDLDSGYAESVGWQHTFARVERDVGVWVKESQRLCPQPQLGVLSRVHETAVGRVPEAVETRWCGEHVSINRVRIYKKCMCLHGHLHVCGSVRASKPSTNLCLLVVLRHL